MTDEEVLRELTLTSSDWRRLPRGFLRRRLLPLGVFAVLCLVLSFGHFWDAYHSGSAEEFRSGLKVLWLLAIPAGFACRVYFEAVMDLKIMKAAALRRAGGMERDRPVTVDK